MLDVRLPETVDSSLGGSAANEVFLLLERWNLLELRNVFEEHDITLRSLIYLTDEEICELVPKIGTRTIFRAMLRDWRRTLNALSQFKTSLAPSLCESNNNNDDSPKNDHIECPDIERFLDDIELKTESNADDYMTSSNLSISSEISAENHITLSQNVTSFSDNPETREKIKLSRQKKKFEKFNVYAILNSCTDGHAVFEFFRQHQYLDLKNRKRVVNLLIRAVVEKGIEKYTAVFHDMTKQILELFPSESYESYFVPHKGTTSARGALYYRYSNYTRQLRKEGLLGYKKHKPRNNFAIK